MNDSPEPLIEYVQGIAERNDRATLAALRSGLRADRQWDALRIVMPFVHTGREADEDLAVLVAALFALHPRSGATPFARMLRVIDAKREGAGIEDRFMALLAADRADLPHHLRHLVALLAGENEPIDWHALYRDLRFWGGGRTQRRWARQFWGATAPSEADTDPSTPTS